jgi:endo-1,4-beta-xylanase
MRRTFSIVLFVLLLAALAVGAAPITPDSPQSGSGGEPERRSPPPLPPEKQRTRQSRESQDMWQIPRKDIPEKMRLASFQSDITRGFVSYLVFLPPGYDRMRNESMRYPVIYMLPPNGDARENGPWILRINDAIEDGTMPPVIVISVQGIFGSMYIDSRDRGRPIESVILRELVTRVDSTYRTVADREHRAVEGYALAGYGAAHLGFKYPDVFGVVSMFAPQLGTIEAMQDEMPQIVSDVFSDDRRYFADNDPWNLVARNAEMIRGKSKIRLYCGAEDRYAVFAEDFHARLNQLGIEHEYILVPGQKHSLDKVLGAVKKRVLPFWKEVFPPYVPPATTQSSP